MAKRRNFSPEFKAKVALAAIRGDGTTAELAAQYKVHPNMIAKWKREALDGMKETFSTGNSQAKRDHEEEIKQLQAKVGELVIERDFLEGLRSLSVDRRRAMIAPEHAQLSVTRQCELVGISRSSWYYRPRGESDRNLRLMREIDEQYLKTPWYGSRQMARHLRRLGRCVGRKRVRRLMRLMGLQAVAPQPNTSRPAPQHKVYPYRLRELRIERAHQVWCADLTYLPMAHGFLYLVAIMDWRARKVLSWRLSTTQDTAFCVEALEEAIERYGRPEIFNTDQGSHFTSSDWIDVLKGHDIQISMDGKGQWMDNVFVERLWRSLKYECVYLNAFRNFKEAKQQIRDWMDYYNDRRPHSKLDDMTPSECYAGIRPLTLAA